MTTKIDRLNPAITPVAKEGYEYKFGGGGWRQTKIITADEKAIKAKVLADAKLAKKELAKQVSPEQKEQ